MKVKVIFLLLMALNCPDTNGQAITFYRNDKLWIAPNTCDLIAYPCEWDGTDNDIFTGYAYHPNGSLLAVVGESIDQSFEFNTINIFNFNLADCSYQLLNSIPLSRYTRISGNGLNVDFQGRIYFSLSEYDETTGQSLQTYNRISGPNSSSIERLLTKVPNHRFWEMHQQDGKYFLLEQDKPYIRVYNSDFDIIDTIIMQKHITGVTSFSFGCDSVITYASHLDITSEEFANSGPGSTVYISTYDFETNVLSPICSYFLNQDAVTHLTSPLEFLSSDPECDLLIDLDRDNDTGVYPYDYLDSNKYCSMLEVPVADEDTYIHTSAPLDSIRLILSGILDAGDETLTMQPIPAGFTFTMVNDSTYLITSTNPSDSLYAVALRSVFYQHNGTSLSAGIRTIIIQGFNDIKEGVLVKSFIQVEASDETLLFSTSCMSSDTGMFVTTHTNQFGCDSVVTLTVTLVPADTTILTLKTCDVAQVGTTENLYVNQDGCDSLVITQTSLYLLPEIQIEVTSDYNGYAISCFGYDDGAVRANVTGIQPWTYMWSTGHEDQTLTGLSAGTYNVTVIDDNGCTASEEVTLIDPSEFEISFVVSEPGCFDHQDGSITVEQIGAIEPVQYSINGSGFQSSPVFNGLGGGTYTITAIDANGCDVVEIIGINVPLELIVDLGEDQMINVGDTAILNAAINIPFDSLAGITWSGLNNPDCPNCLTQPVAPIVTTTYSVSITNHAGCMDDDSLTLLLEYGYNVYIPNIFSPNGDGINDLFMISGGPEIKEISTLAIYDRWGNEIHSASNFLPGDHTRAWDGSVKGKALNPGVFAYKIIILYQDGSSKIKYGDITLIK